MKVVSKLRHTQTPVAFPIGSWQSLRMEKMLQIDLDGKIIETIRRHWHPSRCRIFLFGSRALGTTDPRSDIDIGIESPDKIPLEVLGEIKEELEGLPVLQKFDVVDFSRIDPGFKAIALKTIRLLDER